MSFYFKEYQHDLSVKWKELSGGEVKIVIIFLGHEL